MHEFTYLQLISYKQSIKGHFTLKKFYIGFLEAKLHLFPFCLNLHHNINGGSNFNLEKKQPWTISFSSTIDPLLSRPGCKTKGNCSGGWSRGRNTWLDWSRVDRFFKILVIFHQCSAKVSMHLLIFYTIFFSFGDLNWLLLLQDQFSLSSSHIY